MYNIKKHIILLFIVLMLFCSSCQRAEQQSSEIKDINMTSAGSETKVIENRPEYTNLASETAIKEVQDILLEAGIRAEYVNTVSNWIEDYNDCMKNCKAFSLQGNFTAMDGTTVDYGDYPDMSFEWYKHNNRDYPDVLCRIVAFEMNKDNITVENPIAKKDFDCYDENEAWLYSDGDILFGREETVDEDGYTIPAYAPFPLLEWDKDTISDYFTLFNPVNIKKGCSEQDMFKAIKRHWTKCGITFKDNRYSLITFWIQSENRTAAAHAATLIELDSGYLLFEKTNPTSPYAATTFSSIDDVKQYLYDMMALDYSRDGDNGDFGTYIILQNDKLI